jgi:hypothetical protein
LKRNLFIYTMDKIVAPDHLFEELITGNCGFFQINGLTIQKELCLKVGLMDRNVGYTEDTHFFLKAALSGKIYPGSLLTPTAARIVHEENITVRQRELQTEFTLTMFSSLHKWMQLNKTESKYIQFLRNSSIYYFMINQLYLSPTKFFRIKKSFATLMHFLWKGF